MGIRGQHSYRLRAGLAPALALIADALLWEQAPGAGLAVLALALIAAVALTQPQARRHGWPVLIAAAALGLWQLETPSILAWLGFMVCLAVAVLRGRAGRGQGVWTWAQRLAVMAAGLTRSPLRAGRQLGLRRLKRPKGRSLVGLAGLLVLPVGGGLLFLGLFAAANPLIAEVLSSLRAPSIDAVRVGIWLFLSLAAFALLRPTGLRRPLILEEPSGAARLPGVSPASVTLALLVFNALFALQNGLDIAFLWSGAKLPPQVTLADYAHRGAYPLIFTALLAGLFVLVALAPGSETSRRPLVRWLVTGWVVQNVFLVASSILRTLDYIDAYSLTRLRIAALAWMGLVAVGLILICWRMLRRRSAAWLINANALCAGLVLAVFVVVDSGAVAADWNVRHARPDGQGPALDLCYLSRLGPSALIPLAELERQPLPEDQRRRVAAVRQTVTDSLGRRQADWRGWSWRGQRRLDRALAVAGPPAASIPFSCSGDSGYDSR